MHARCQMTRGDGPAAGAHQVRAYSSRLQPDATTRNTLVDLCGAVVACPTSSRLALPRRQGHDIDAGCLSCNGQRLYDRAAGVHALTRRSFSERLCRRAACVWCRSPDERSLSSSPWRVPVGVTRRAWRPSAATSGRSRWTYGLGASLRRRLRYAGGASTRSNACVKKQATVSSPHRGRPPHCV